MGKLIVIRLEEGSFKNGFQVVNLQIAEDGQPFHHQPKTTSLPVDPELDEFYENLKKHGFIHNLNGWKSSSDSFKKLLNKWLESLSFLLKWNEILTDCTSQDIIRVVLQTQDPELAKLPWHLWNFFETYPFAEIAFSLPEYKVQPCYPTRTEARILAILGDSTGIDIATDEGELKLLSPKTCFLPQKDQETIFRHLNDEESWDILFFAGHSKTSGEKGILYINETDSIKIDDLEYAVKKAISKGLRLAIFNSCDGFGLARTLASWNLPQVIVMRQPIYDEVAQKFLKYFLTAFVQEKIHPNGHIYDTTLYLALRKARESLQGLERQYPLASWFPVMYDQSFAVEGSLTWKQLPKQSRMRGTPLNDSNDPYIDRPPLEQTCYDAIVKPGGLIRITAPQKMGKTLLLNKVLSKVIKNLEYKTVILKCDEFSTDDLENNAAFFRSFCSAVSIKLKLEDKTCEYWETRYPSVGDILKASLYFEEYLLCTITHNLVLALDNFESLFSKLHIFEEFCRFLRNSHEKSAQPDEEHLLWEKLRLVIVNSTEKYPELDDNCSPFKGVGNDINERVGLQNFTDNQVKQLLENAKIDTKVSEQNLSSLMDLVKGHPYLIKQAFDYLKQDKGNSLDKILDDKADLEQGIFGYYLKKQLNSLKINSNLMAAYKTVILTSEPVRIDDEKFRFQLHSLGLIKLIDGDYNCVVSCDLYRRYFSKFFQINLYNKPIEKELR